MNRLLWLLGVVLGLGLVDGAIAWFDARTEKAREFRPGDSLVSFEPPGIAKIVVARSGKKPLVVERVRGGAWAVSSAKGFPARSGKPDQTLQRILGWKRSRIAGEKAIHDDFAVTREKGISIRLEDFSGATVAEILMGSLTGIDPENARQRGGNVDPTTIGRYMRLDGEDAVYVIPDFVTGELEPDPMEWLERPITGGDEAKAHGLVIRRRAGEHLAILLDAPFPRLATPEQRPVDADKARALVREVLQAWAVDALDGEDQKLGLQPPALTAEVVGADGSRVTLQLGDLAPPASGTLPGYAARVPDKPGPLLVPQSAVSGLFSATAESVALAHVFGERFATTLAKASFKEGDKTVTLARDGAGSWTVATLHSGLSTAPRKVEDEAKKMRLLEAAVKLPVATFDHAQVMGHGLVQPLATLTVDIGKETLAVHFGAQEGAVVWTRRADLPCALGIPVEAVAELRAAFASIGE